jgi:hypothetical protein
LAGFHHLKSKQKILSIKFPFFTNIAEGSVILESEDIIKFKELHNTRSLYLSPVRPLPLLLPCELPMFKLIISSLVGKAQEWGTFPKFGAGLE